MPRMKNNFWCMHMCNMQHNIRSHFVLQYFIIIIIFWCRGLQKIRIFLLLMNISSTASQHFMCVIIAWDSHVFFSLRQENKNDNVERSTSETQETTQFALLRIETLWGEAAGERRQRRSMIYSKKIPVHFYLSSAFISYADEKELVHTLYCWAMCSCLHNLHFLFETFYVKIHTSFYTWYALVHSHGQFADNIFFLLLFTFSRFCTMLLSSRVRCQNCMHYKTVVFV